MVLPYLNATGSGVVPIAYHYGRPVLLTRVGGLPDVVFDRQTGWIVPPRDARALANAIRGMNMKTCKSMRKAIDEFKATLTWESLASTVACQPGR